jgi:transcriptional regulator of aroF, aroG, tyrA and aromatic amino acid transport
MHKKELSIEITFRDRVGFIADIAKTIADCNMNIFSMELKESNDLSKLYVGLETISENNENDLFRKIKYIDNVENIVMIDTLPQIEREMRYKIVLDSMSEGIVSVNNQGEITTINKVAGEIFGISNVERLVGADIHSAKIKSDNLLKTLRICEPFQFTENIKNKDGSFQYFSTCQPIKNKKGKIIGAVEVMKSVKEIKELANSVSMEIGFTFDDIVTKNQIMLQTIELAKKVAVTDSFVMLKGESGTGKECFANAIHNYSGRTGKWIAINCAAIPDNLLESELFGFIGGVFSGADKKGKKGLIEEADKGTIFLDEISELSWNMQAKLLRVLQEKKVRKIGSGNEIPVDVRFIAATNKNLESLVEEGKFREDLFYRLNVLPIYLPPLRSRKDDISILFEYFLNELNKKLYSKIKSIDKKVFEKLEKHYWKGNVRELKNVVERAFILAENNEISLKHIIFSSNFSKENITYDENKSLKQIIREVESKIIKKALQEHESIRQAAKFLGISHVALLNKMKKLDIFC